VNQGKAVYMNGRWQTCQADDHPGTCGELRARAERGYILVGGDGNVGAGTTFAGDDPSLSMFSLPAEDYSRLWEGWGYEQRPENFDELVAERWGTALSPNHNPYPLPGEDPNANDGGSGQLPMALTQLREADGTWTGTLGVTCNVCHAGKVGEPSDGPGLGSMHGTNSLSDMTVMFADLGNVVPIVSAAAIFSVNRVRGTGNITNFQAFIALELAGDVAQTGPALLSVQGEPSTGTEDPPVWWNLGHRVHKFFDGGQVVGSKRIDLSFHMPRAPIHGLGSLWEEDKQWILDHMQDGDAWLTSLRSPAWPEAKLGSIDEPLAEQGSILFHAKDLWAEGLDNPSPAPDGGNGSCASCHGAYSARFVHDPAFLDSPLLEGIAAYIVPLDVIDTDPQRLFGNSDVVAAAAPTTWFTYAEGPLADNGEPLCGNWNSENLRGDRELGYLAPPLYGVWATAPYFHNGSVPNVWEVLHPEQRKTIWRRTSAPPPADNPDMVMGFATTLDYYDTEKLGWTYEALECSDSGALDCSKPEPETLGATLDILANTGLAWNLLGEPPFDDQTIEDRKVYTPTRYSQSNSGHAFSSVLTDAETLAIIESLKTL